LQKHEFIQEFKTVFFLGCIPKSFSDPTVGYLIPTDLSYSHDFALGLSSYEIIDTLTSAVALQIESDSIKWINTIGKNLTPEEFENARLEGYIGKRTFKFCLNYYTSKELDDISKAQYKNR
jgi:hypothetical protein